MNTLSQAFDPTSPQSEVAKPASLNSGAPEFVWDNEPVDFPGFTLLNVPTYDYNIQKTAPKPAPEKAATFQLNANAASFDFKGGFQVESKPFVPTEVAPEVVAEVPRKVSVVPAKTDREIRLENALAKLTSDLPGL